MRFGDPRTIPSRRKRPGEPTVEERKRRRKEGRAIAAKIRKAYVDEHGQEDRPKEMTIWAHQHGVITKREAYRVEWHI